MCRTRTSRRTCLKFCLAAAPCHLRARPCERGIESLSETRSSCRPELWADELLVGTHLPPRGTTMLARGGSAGVASHRWRPGKATVAEACEYAGPGQVPGRPG